MTQRDRLAALLPYIRHRATCALQAVRDNAPDDEACTCGLREVWLGLSRRRVVDEETLARAIRSLYTDRNYLGHEAARDAAAILAALDAEPVKKRTRIYQSDVVVDEGDEEP